MDFSFAPKCTCSNLSNKDNINSDLSAIGFKLSPYPSAISIAFIWSLLLEDIWITSPPKDSIKAEYSFSGSHIKISSSVDSAKKTINCFAQKLLPDPGTPNKKAD